MNGNLYYSVRLQGLERISDKCYKAMAFDGSEALIPASQIAGQDYEVIKSDAWWISAWILSKKELQYSRKKSAYFDKSGNMLPEVSIEDNIPEHLAPLKSNIITELNK